jgi:hypothetical protein
MSWPSTFCPRLGQHGQTPTSPATRWIELIGALPSLRKSISNGIYGKTILASTFRETPMQIPCGPASLDQ